MSVARHHAEWLSLVEQSGPFLSMPVLLRVLPQGLDAHDPDHHRQIKLAHGEWEAGSDDPATHRAWVRFVLGQTLEMPDDVLAEGQAVTNIKCEVAEHGETLRPDLAVLLDGKPCLLVHVYRREQNLDRPPAEAEWKASCGTRMMELLHAADVRLGIVTNGEQWMLVYAPRGETTGFASWYASYWIEEPITFRAFRTLLSARRFFSVPEGETLSAMLKESAENQHEVTDQLGYQVRKAVEVLIQSLDRADQDHGRALLGQVAEGELYEAALTVMMRLVFLFSAEERGLLLLGDPLYDEHYAVSTLRERLRTDADQHGEEVLERRLDAWVRLLAAFRAVHGGVSHHRLTLPAYGGHLFDPDRFPFLEGRQRGTKWQETPATPLPVNNRTVLHLLEALQLLRVKVPGGGPAEARRLSFRALDIEQIGHVYEGLLDHTAVRATEPALGLAGAKDQEPEVPLAELATHRAKGEKELLKYLKDVTGRSESALKKALAVAVDGHDASRLRVACGNRAELFDRVRPFAGLLREDSFGYPVVIPAGSVYVTEGTTRRATGTHYTPRSLTEPIVRYTLEPLIYDGPSDGKPNDQWRLKSARELLALKVCDIACGSGAFLVEACRYLSERLVEAWQKADRFAGGRQGRINFDQPNAADPAPRLRPRITPFGEPAKGRLGEQIIPDDDAARLTFARRLVAQRCLYGVDKNSMAVEIAKLSLWLLTLAKGQPFTFLDHAVRHGDSLVGVHDLDQLRHLTLSGRKEDANLFISTLDDAVKQAVEKRLELESLEVIDIEDVHRQEELFREADTLTKKLRAVGDVLIGTAFGGDEMDLLPVVSRYKEASPSELEATAAECRRGQTPFHWPLEFPEVFFKQGGFDACIGNPPFMGGQKITGFLGTLYREYLVTQLAKGKRGSADLCAYFFLRAAQLIRPGAGFGLIASNTIAQGDTREVALDLLLAANFIVNRAHSSRPWPGLASLEISIVWVRRGGWNGIYVLDEKPAPGITPYLTPPNAVSGNPYRLKTNENKSFQGSNVLGLGFMLTPEEAQRLVEKDARNKDVLFPYLNGEDLNSRPDHSPSRWVINFFDWPLEKAKNYPDCFRIVEEKVKPDRERNNDRRRREIWWQFTRIATDLHEAITGVSQVLVRARIANMHSMAWVPAGWVYNEKTVVFVGCSFSVMQSNIHEVWARQFSSTLRTDMQYTPSDCFETFPFPVTLPPSADQIGERYHAHRRDVMLARQEGLTKTYNRFHNPDDRFDGIIKLRSLHVELDQAVSAAYGWSDLDLSHGFHETKQGVRYTISEPARREVLARLLKLNHERYAEEKRLGLHEPKKAAKGKGRSKPETSGSLFE